MKWNSKERRIFLQYVFFPLDTSEIYIMDLYNGSLSYKIREKLPVPRQSQPGEEKNVCEKEDAESVI